MEKYKTLQLNEYFNNCGISTRDEISKGNFTGVGSSYPSEEFPESGQCLRLEGIPFLFPSKDPDKPNNIEFYNQKIVIPSNFYNKIHFLGAADNGSYKEYITVSGDHKSDRLALGFTEWLSKEPQFGEKMALRCNCIHSSMGGVIDSFKPAIWYTSVNCSDIEYKINSIKLEDNPGMHIFSITLEKRAEINAK